MRSTTSIAQCPTELCFQSVPHQPPLLPHCLPPHPSLQERGTDQHASQAMGTLWPFHSWVWDVMGNVENAGGQCQIRLIPVHREMAGWWVEETRRERIPMTWGKCHQSLRQGFWLLEMGYLGLIPSSACVWEVFFSLAESMCRSVEDSSYKYLPRRAFRRMKWVSINKVLRTVLGAW